MSKAVQPCVVLFAFGVLRLYVCCALGAVAALTVQHSVCACSQGINPTLLSIVMYLNGKAVRLYLPSYLPLVLWLPLLYSTPCARVLRASACNLRASAEQ